jgi:hypothetical protein
MKASGIVPSFLFLALAGAIPAQAQTFRPGIEVGGQAVIGRLGSDNAPVSTGFSGRLTFDFSRWIALDGEVSFFPKDDWRQPFADAPPVSSLVYQRDRIEGLAGIKAGYRGDRIGVFAKARPGFSRLSHKGVDCGGDLCPLILVAVPEYKTEFAFDLGGVLEVYPTSRIVARFDLGDVMTTQNEFAPQTSTHNLTTRLGIGFRF